eukprot:m.98816 g.98816  ORF g.98816 m.98816 type:complete len:1089 (+) comp10280_c0_seq1:404-3670(+)
MQRRHLQEGHGRDHGGDVIDRHWVPHDSPGSWRARGRAMRWSAYPAVVVCALATLSALPALADECSGQYDRLMPLSTLNKFVYFNDLNTDTIAGTNASTSSYFNSFKMLTFPKRTPDSFTCNGSESTVLCQLAAFDVNHEPFNNEIPVETTLARAGNSPTLWECTTGLANTVLAPNGGWQLRSVQNVSSPYIRQAKLLKQAELFIDAISTGGELVDRFVSSNLCPTLTASSTEFNITCTRPKLGTLLRRLVLPIMDETITDSEEDVRLATTVTYACLPNVRGVPLVNLTEATLPNNASHDSSLEFNVTIGHACCCDAATVDCRTGYAEHIALQQDRAKCDDYQALEFQVIGIAGLIVFVLVLVAERRAAETYEPVLLCESVTRHPKYLLKDCFFFLNILSPVNLMENRRGSMVVASIFGTLAALIFTEIVQPNGAQFLRATLWLFLIYPLFLCRSCHERLAGSILGICYCVVFTFFMWLRLSCRWRAGQHDQALYVLIPAICCNCFIGWFAFRAYKEFKSRVHAREEEAATRANSRDSASSDMYLRRPRALTLSDQGTHRQYDHNELVMELLVPKSQQLKDAENEVTARKTVWEQLVGLVMSYGRDFRQKYNYFRYSPRMLIMASMSWCMLFNFMVLLGFLMAEFVPWGEDQLSGGLCCGGVRCHHGDAYLWEKWTENSTLTNLIDASPSSPLGGTYDDCHTNLRILRSFQITLVTAGVLMAFAHAASVLNLVAVYRKHMMRFYRGQTTFLSKFTPGPYIALTDCLKYVSYQVIFVICGWVFSTVLCGAAFMFVTFTVILPLDGAYKDQFWTWLWTSYCWNGEENEMGPLMLTLVLYGIMMVMVWVCFMDRNVNMALTNRTLWDTFDLFQTIANFLVGFFMFLKRILVQILFGAIFISRLDKPLVPRGYEFWDPGFACYQGFLLTEMYYGNPVMLTFVQILADAYIVLNRKKLDDDDDFTVRPMSPQRRLSVRAERYGRVDSQAFKRWQLVYTLLRNPELVADRRQSGRVAQFEVRGKKRGWFRKPPATNIQMVPVHQEDQPSRYNSENGDDDDESLIRANLSRNASYEEDGYMDVDATFQSRDDSTA